MLNCSTIKLIFRLLCILIVAGFAFEVHFHSREKKQLAELRNDKLVIGGCHDGFRDSLQQIYGSLTGTCLQANTS